MSATHALFKYTARPPKPATIMTQKVTIEGEMEKVELPVFSVDSPPTTLVHLTREFINIIDTYELFDAEKPTRVYNRFRRGLQGYPATIGMNSYKIKR